MVAGKMDDDWMNDRKTNTGNYKQLMDNCMDRWMDVTSGENSIEKKSETHFPLVFTYRSSCVKRKYFTSAIFQTLNIPVIRILKLHEREPGFEVTSIDENQPI
ncbi:hypothetical protein GOODEAATRI_008326 [Goodea atripinnis]|uniref:Glutaredoxin domain-containing protein n=1 Tax=Goodea atripinnis TaxID=208336 RepID=A0ABV0PCI8_9TELE